MSHAIEISFNSFDFLIVEQKTEDLNPSVGLKIQIEMQGMDLGKGIIAVRKNIFDDCEQQLDSQTRELVASIPTENDLWIELEKVRQEETVANFSRLQSMIKPYLSLINRLGHALNNMNEVALLWGLLCVAVLVCLEKQVTNEGMIRMMRELSRMLGRVNRLYALSDQEILNEVKEDMLQGMYDEALNTLQAHYETVKTFSNGFFPHGKELRKFVDLLNTEYLEQKALDAPNRWPCHDIPIDRNEHFFGREDVLSVIDRQLEPSLQKGGVKRVVLYGIKGIGKTQISLHYAYSKRDTVDVVLWIPAGDALSIQHRLSNIAVASLRLDGVESQSHKDNAVRVIDWLENTDARWLLVYDDASSANLLKQYCPKTNHGAILVTANSRHLAHQFAHKQKCLEIKGFDDTEGTRFLLNCLSPDDLEESATEYEAAKDLSRELGGHALGMHQIAALIDSRAESIERFVPIYKSKMELFHRDLDEDWDPHNFKDCLGTLWQLSFENLQPYDRICLGVLAYLTPNFTPIEIFRLPKDTISPEKLDFCKDQGYSLGNVQRHLLDLALITVDTRGDTISVHRLVQAEYRFHSSQNDRQENFDTAVHLLLRKFPSRGGSRILEKDWPIAERYILQVLALIKNYRQEERSLRSSGELCNLICDATWYLFLNDTAENLELVLETGFEAYYAWDDLEKDVLIRAYLLCNSALHNVNLGEFHNALRKTEECLSIQKSKLLPNDEQILNSYNNLGIIHGSLANYTTGLACFEKAREILRSDPSENPAKSILLSLNTARNLYCMCNYEKAKECLDSALADSYIVESWYWRLSVYIGFNSLYFRMNDLATAHKYIELAEDAIEKSRVTRLTPLKGCYAFQLGRLYLAQNKFQESIKQFEYALTVCKYCKLSVGAKARVHFALFKATEQDPTRQEEALKHQADAFRLRERILANRREIRRDDDFEAFDLLVKIMER
ncbi:hypothetical protein BJ875DRAFT_438544 [Amylocarpus encephaloides]|uniref:NB-ARC domain-containing protein n=1 Tax=Amylocarpus encephaloides TaxID=45428 RepID=A0A9P7YPQ6_9HELO|nr:hypothetical protein BJ875DRAFT_438544 [Amylocarpus encephaloides]